jgi:hypothetical protein
MAITTLDYLIIAQVKKLGLIPTHPAVLELGEANWYGDVSIDQLVADIKQHVTDADRQKALLQRLRTLCNERPQTFLFDVAKIFHQTFFNPRLLEAIDLSGSPAAMRFDLNQPVPLQKNYDVIMNLGTAEHVFNVYQFFKTVHELCAPEGLMLHLMPFNGWFDHGFYNFQSTFYFDLALANNYSMHLLAYTELNPPKIKFCSRREDIIQLAQAGGVGVNALLYAVLRKSKVAAPFQVPMQGYYAGTLSKEGERAWGAMR